MIQIWPRHKAMTVTYTIGYYLLRRTCRWQMNFACSDFIYITIELALARTKFYIKTCLKRCVAYRLPNAVLCPDVLFVERRWLFGVCTNDLLHRLKKNSMGWFRWSIFFSSHAPSWLLWTMMIPCYSGHHAYVGLNWISQCVLNAPAV